MAVGDIPYVGVVVTNAVRLELCEQLAAAGVVQMVNARSAIGRHYSQLFGITFHEPWNKRAGALFEVAKHFDFIRKSLIGLGPAKLFIDLAIVADTHRGAECVFNLLHEYPVGMRVRSG
jgi:hypothetical protein